MSGPLDLPRILPTPGEAVVERLARTGLPVRSVWFPTRGDLARWATSGCPLYVRRLGPRSVQVGPRLDNMWASVFSPVLELRLSEGEEPELAVRKRLDHVTTAVLVGWSVVVLLWGGALLTGAVPPALPFWLLIAGATVAAPLVGWTQGGRALEAGLPWLVEVLLAPDEEEDW